MKIEQILQETFIKKMKRKDLINISYKKMFRKINKKHRKSLVNLVEKWEEICGESRYDAFFTQANKTIYCSISRR